VGDVWFVDKGLRRGIYFEEQYDLDRFLDQVPKAAAETSRENPRLSSIMMQYAGLAVRLATPQEILYFRMQTFRETQQHEIKRIAKDNRLPHNLAALLVDSSPKSPR